jgi:hypothetical protein
VGYSFDGATKVITLTAGTTTMSVRDVWSRWVDWIALSDNSKYLPAFLTVGGDDIDPVAGTTIPIYAFLINGWKIKPQEANHTLAVTDGILLVDGGGDPFINTTGSYIVRINYQQPVQAISFASEGGEAPSAAEVATAVWSEVLIGSTITAAQLMQVISAALSGKLSGAGTSLVKIRDLEDTKDIISAVVDSSGNRLTVTLDL